MKTLAKYIALIVVCFGLIGLTSCRKENRRSQMTILMTDAPADYKEVNVEIIAMDVHYDDSKHQPEGWVRLNVKQGIYNLLELQNDITVVLVDNEEIPLGKITQLRLLLGSNNTLVFKDNSVFDLKVPSGEQTGIKINIDQEVKYKKDIEILIDFDAEKSVVEKGNGEFSLKPVIKVKSVIEK